ncbi:MAG: hypothetical protein Tsb0017_23920 [Geothermobacteraceae bacterium]
MPTTRPTWNDHDRAALLLAGNGVSRAYLLRLIDATGLFQQIHCAPGREEARALLREEEIDAIFFDWDAPHLDSSLQQLADMLAETEEWRDIPLLVLTTETERETCLAAFLAGACDCLGYGIPAADLRSRLFPHLSRKLRIDALREENDQLAKLAISDGLTGLYNRNYFDVALQFEVSRCQRYGHPLSLLVITIDRFPWLNDHFGYRAGDKVLTLVGDAIRDVVRDADIPCRFNHQDFAIVLPDTAAPDAYQLAERLRNELEERQPRHPFNRFHLSLSMGISGLCGTSNITPANLIEEAYCAIETGRRFGAGRTEIFSHNMEVVGENGQSLDLDHPVGNA